MFATRSARGLLHMAGVALLLGVTPGCSTESATSTPSQTLSAVAMQRVVVTLQPATSSPAQAASDTARMEKAVKHLETTFPKASILRTMPAFAQLVIELPDGDLAALAADPMVLSAKPDARHSTSEKSTH